MNDFADIRSAQLAFFRAGHTRSYKARKGALLALKHSVKDHEEDILQALASDLGKPELEAFAAEISFIYQEIDHMLERLAGYMQDRRVKSSLALFPSRSWVQKEPLGQVLIIGPWNYPFQLLAAPLVGALAAGNTVLLKPSEFTPATSAVIGRVVAKAFSKEWVAIAEGDGAQVVPQIFESYQPSMVFFTGSPDVGKIIAQRCAQDLIPVVLELGGKSPAIFDGTWVSKTAVKRLLYAKFINAGQTCIAPDYVLIKHSAFDSFVSLAREILNEWYGTDPLKSPDLTQLIHDRHFQRVQSYLEQGEVLHGGQHRASDRRIAPTLLRPSSWDQTCMKDEIFGPVLPIATYETDEELLDLARRNPDPLAAYIFSKDYRFADRISRELPFGGGCINNAMLHIVNPHLPFGGVRNSGWGAYHGRHSFDSFSHSKSMIKTGRWFDLKQKYPPYSALALKLIKKLM